MNVVVEVGGGDGADLAATLAERGFTRALLLAGRERRLQAGGAIAAAVAVYASDPLPIDDTAIEALFGSVALVHSARAAARLGDLVGPFRGSIRLAAISAAAAAAAGPGWDRVAVAPSPDDAAVVTLAGNLAD